MDDRAIGQELERDLLRAAATGKVLYLEGPTDLLMLLGLLGREPPTVVPEEGMPVDGVWVRGISGSKAVEQRIDVAGRLGFRDFRGIVDGDGKDLEALAATFDPPFNGPLYHWKAYCLENLLTECSWPNWGPAPDWRSVLAAYIPYAALNRVVAAAQERWRSLGVARFGRPIFDQPRRTTEEIRNQLHRDASDLRDLGDLVGLYDAEVNRCETALATSLSHAHALVNGKWLVEVHAAEASRGSPERCRQAWAMHVGRTGGHPEVVAWWRRLQAA
ncbi:MAG TPA: hypothetical protein VGB85_08525 [Nannocystis sp.]|jgi:hypothetical protein